MTNTSITNARANLFKITEKVIKLNDVVNITTKEGNVVMMSESDYNNLMATLHFYSVPGMAESIIDGLNEPIEECKTFNWKEELEE